MFHGFRWFKICENKKLARDQHLDFALGLPAEVSVPRPAVLPIPLSPLQEVVEQAGYFIIRKTANKTVIRTAYNGSL